MVASLIVGAAVTVYFKSLACGAASFLTGVFLDIDHILDYFWNCGVRFNIREFYDYCINVRYKRISLILHSYELLIVLWVLIIALGLGNIWKAIAIGATQHLVLDHMRNASTGRMNWRSYFLSFRIKNRFKTEKITKR
ncbi:hypothetical protein OAA99_01070 [Omnitrophica bacterium]|nr:hypothetical protein [Candidatus Omnitrophota bacterium]